MLCEGCDKTVCDTDCAQQVLKTAQALGADGKPGLTGCHHLFSIRGEGQGLGAYYAKMAIGRIK